MMATYFRVYSILGNVLNILAILHEVSPSGSYLRILDLAILEFQAEVCVDGEK